MREHMKRISLSSLAVAVFAVSTLPLAAQSASVFDSISAEVKAVYEKAAPAIVRIRAQDMSGSLAGTAFFIDDQGTLLTSAAIVDQGSKCWIEYREKKVEAALVSRDPRSGIALLSADLKGTPFLKLGDSSQVQIASSVVSVAYPFNLPAAPNFGLVAGFDVQYLNRFFATTHMRANVAVAPGQIGGPLLNAKAEVVGLMVMAIDDGKACYALPSNSAAKVIQDIRKFGEARHGWVGVGVVEARDPENFGSIVRVSQLFEDTPALTSGIRSGDRVLRIGGRTINRPSDILDAAFFSTVGEKIPVVIEREGREMTFQIEVRERPANSRPVTPPSGSVPAPANEPVQVKGRS